MIGKSGCLSFPGLRVASRNDELVRELFVTGASQRRAEPIEMLMEAGSLRLIGSLHQVFIIANRLVHGRVTSSVLLKHLVLQAYQF